MCVRPTDQGNVLRALIENITERCHSRKDDLRKRKEKQRCLGPLAAKQGPHKYGMQMAGRFVATSWLTQPLGDVCAATYNNFIEQQRAPGREEKRHGKPDKIVEVMHDNAGKKACRHTRTHTRIHAHTHKTWIPAS